MLNEQSKCYLADLRGNLLLYEDAWFLKVKIGERERERERATCLTCLLALAATA